MLLTSPAPMCRRCLFAALVFLHSGGVLFAPQVLAPVMAGSVYLLLMQKRVYRQGWTMTLLKYCMLGFCYCILLSIGIAFTAVLILVWM